MFRNFDSQLLTPPLLKLTNANVRTETMKLKLYSHIFILSSIRSSSCDQHERNNLTRANEESQRPDAVPANSFTEPTSLYQNETQVEGTARQARIAAGP